MKKKYFTLSILILLITIVFSWRFASATIPSTLLRASPSDYGLKEGDLISAIFSDDPDVYIVNEHGYKRLFLNPDIFKFYTHLGGFANIKLVTPEVRDSFPTVGFFRNCEDNDHKVYGTSVEGEDSGRLHWINKSGDQAVQEDSEFFKKVFCINRKEFNWYPRGTEYKALKEVPQYHRAEEAEKPVICHHPSDQPNEPKNFQTIRVAPEALDAHFQHGDTKGACSTVSIQQTFPVDVKINGSDNPASVPYDSVFTVSWTSNSAVSCRDFGQFIPTVDGGTWAKFINLPTSGTKSLYARASEGYLATLDIQVQCSNAIGQFSDDVIHLSVQVPTTAPIPNISPTQIPIPTPSTNSASITVISPNGGETWQKDITQLIKWNSSNVPKVYIKLRKGNDTYFGPEGKITDVIPNEGGFKWTPPTTLPDGNDYSIRVIDGNLTGSLDDSDAPFNIISAVTSLVKPMVLKDILKVESVIPYDVANLSFGVYQVSAQYNLGAYHLGKWYEGLNPGISGPVWIEFGWPNTPQVDVVLRDENDQQRKIYLPATGSNKNPDGSSSNWYYWISEDGSSYYGRKDHNYGWPDLSSIEALRPEHIARKAGVFSSPTPTPTPYYSPTFTPTPTSSYSPTPTPTPIPTSSNTCSTFTESQKYYFDLCAKEGYDNVCLDKATGAYQGCTRNTYNDCTLYNVNKDKNLLCAVSNISTPTPTPTPTPTINQIDFAVTSVSALPSSVVAGNSIAVSATFYNPFNTTQSIQVTIGKGVASTNDGTIMSTTYYLSLPPGNTTQTQTFTASYGAISSAPGSPANTYYPEASISGVGNGSIYINPYDPNTANNYLRATTAYTVTNNTTPTPTPSDVTPPIISGERVDVAYSSAMASWTALVVWLTDENSTSQVEYGLTSSYGTITPLDSSGAFLRTVHSIILSPEYGYNLTSNTTYHYRMISKDAMYNSVVSGDYTFATATAPTAQSNFFRNLTMGSTGLDVKQLQALLVNEVGYSADLITGYFGRITRDAVKRLQEKYGVKPISGYFGEITRRALNAVRSGQ